MKRLFLPAICTFALLALVGQSLSAQQAATTPKNDKVIIIQKTQNDDGTWTVKKKSLEKGQAADAYLEEIDLENALETVSEVIVVTGDGAKAESADAETVIMIRRGSHKTEIKWNDSEGGTEPQSWLDNTKSLKPGLHNLSDLALIGEEAGEPKAFLGIYPESHENGGVLVTDLVPASGAANAGLRSGDIITSIDGKTLASRGGLSGTLGNYKPGDAILVNYLREGQQLSATVILTGKKQERHFSYNYNYNYNYNDNYNHDYKSERSPCEVFIGVQIGNWGNGEKGVGVDGIIAGWPAEVAGMMAGDRITSMDGVPVNTHNELVIERDKHKAGEYFTIGYLRGGKESKVKAQFKVCPGEEAPAEVVEVQPVLPKIDNSLQLEELNAFPNPTYGDLSVKFQGDAVPTTVTITDITGKAIFNESLPNFDGTYDRQVDVSKGASGTLMISIRQEGKVLTKPVVLLNRA